MKEFKDMNIFDIASVLQDTISSKQEIYLGVKGAYYPINTIVVGRDCIFLMSDELEGDCEGEDE